MSRVSFYLPLVPLFIASDQRYSFLIFNKMSKERSFSLILEVLFDPISIRLIIGKLILNKLIACDLEIDSAVHQVGLRLKTEDKAIDLLNQLRALLPRGRRYQ